MFFAYKINLWFSKISKHTSKKFVGNFFTSYFSKNPNDFICYINSAVFLGVEYYSNIFEGIDYCINVKFFERDNYMIYKLNFLLGKLKMLRECQ